MTVLLIIRRLGWILININAWGKWNENISFNSGSHRIITNTLRQRETKVQILNDNPHQLPVDHYRPTAICHKFERLILSFPTKTCHCRDPRISSPVAIWYSGKYGYPKDNRLTIWTSPWETRRRFRAVGKAILRPAQDGCHKIKQKFATRFPERAFMLPKDFSLRLGVINNFGNFIFGGSYLSRDGAIVCDKRPLRGAEPGWLNLWSIRRDETSISHSVYFMI